MLKNFRLNACLHAVRLEAWFETVLDRTFSKTNSFRTSAVLVTLMLAFHESNLTSLIKSRFIQNFCVVIAWLFWLSISHLLKLGLEFFFLWKNSNDMHVNWRYSFFDLRSVLLALDWKKTSMCENFIFACAFSTACFHCFVTSKWAQTASTSFLK